MSEPLADIAPFVFMGCSFVMLVKLEYGWIVGLFGGVMSVSLVLTLGILLTYLLEMLFGVERLYDERVFDSELMDVSVIAATVLWVVLSYYVVFIRKDKEKGIRSLVLQEGYEKFLGGRERFSYPDWEVVGAYIEAEFSEGDVPREWEKVSREWVSRLCGAMGEYNNLYETENFLFVSPYGASEAKRATKFYEESLKQILKYLDGVALDEGEGKHVVLYFANVDDYYAYISYFYKDGEHATSSGICISGGGYTHFAVVMSEHGDGREVFVHELTHCLLSHLTLPTWLNEALAMRMEVALVRNLAFDHDLDIFNRHREYWNEKTIQLFWAGVSFGIPGDPNELSYHLAQILWRKIERDMCLPRERMIGFVAAAQAEDSGDVACDEFLGISLGELVEDFLGDGDWQPKPDLWDSLVREVQEGYLNVTISGRWSDAFG